MVSSTFRNYQYLCTQKSNDHANEEHYDYCRHAGIMPEDGGKYPMDKRGL